MALLKDFYPYIMPAVQGCPSAIVDNAIRSAIIDFCERTQMWKYTFPTTNIVSGQAVYTLSPAVDTLIAKPTFVSVEDTPLAPTNEEDLDSCMPGWRTTTATKPMMYFMDFDGNITMVPTPNVDISNALKVEVALKPTISSMSCPDWLLQNWVETIAHGALMRLHAMPGKVWADPQTAGYHKAKYRDGVSRAKSRTMKSFAKQGKTVQPRSFWE